MWGMETKKRLASKPRSSEKKILRVKSKTVSASRAIAALEVSLLEKINTLRGEVSNSVGACAFNCDVIRLKAEVQVIDDELKSQNLDDLWQRSRDMERQIDTLRTRIQTLEGGVPGRDEVGNAGGSPAVSEPTPEVRPCPIKCVATRGCIVPAEFRVSDEACCASHLVYLATRGERILSGTKLLISRI